MTLLQCLSYLWGARITMTYFIPMKIPVPHSFLNLKKYNRHEFLLNQHKDDHPLTLVPSSSSSTIFDRRRAAYDDQRIGCRTVSVACFIEKNQSMTKKIHSDKVCTRIWADVNKCALQNYLFLWLKTQSNVTCLRHHLYFQRNKSCRKSSLTFRRTKQILKLSKLLFQCILFYFELLQHCKDKVEE